MRTSLDLPEARHARPSAAVERLVVFGPKREFLFEQRTHADDAHFTGEHVQQLWQLVETRLAQQSTDGGDSRIIGTELEVVVHDTSDAALRRASTSSWVPSRMVRNLSDLEESTPSRPTRRCRKSTGPGLVILTAAAMTSQGHECRSEHHREATADIEDALHGQVRRARPESWCLNRQERSRS